MPSTYTLISSNVLASSAASVTFSAIPSTYTDLVLRISGRSDQSGQTESLIKIRTNGLSTTIYSDTDLTGNGSAASSGRDSSATAIYAGYVNGPSSASNTFSSNEIYFSNYTSSANKPQSIISAQENNTTAAYIRALATLTRDTTATTSIEISFLSGGVNFVSGSSFYLYGIKNS